ncbi:MAG: transcriptional repressor [Tannerella sp.]|jgi:Fur family ferric uptake transcriptional regulator|nr:transcriptional repressor [Tannerella sp.]
MFALNGQVENQQMEMNTGTYDPENIKELFTQYLENNNLRKTTERYTILHHICMIKGHFDVEMLQQKLDGDNFHVSRASIYNTIMLLLDASLIVRHQFTSQIVQYELRAVAETHHHTFCNYCGAVNEIKNVRLHREMQFLRIPKFTHTHHLLYIYGMCSKCKFRLSRKQQSKKNNITEK